MEKFEKLRISMRYRLLGATGVDKAYQVALDAYDFAEQHHVGVRKDGLTPNFMHQLEVMAYLTTFLKGLRHPAETLAAAALHDICEDCGVPLADIRTRFGERVAHATRRLSKVVEGSKVADLSTYFDQMLDCPIATVVKGSDRINNQSTMAGVFTREKQLSYIEESETHIVPMLKQARRLFSDQEPVYENIKLVLRNQIVLIRASHMAKDAP